MKFNKYQMFFYSLFFLVIQDFVAQSDYDNAYNELRSKVYNSNGSKEQKVISSYNNAYALIKKDNSVKCYIEKSKCDYLMGLFYMDQENNSKAIDYFQSSMDLAYKANKKKETAQGFLAYAESLAQICTLKPTSYLIANGLKVGTIAKKALKLDKGLGAARYLVCSIIAYAPIPFRNFSKAEKIYLEILEKDNLDEEDYFNVYKSLGYINYQKEQFEEADKWFDLAAKIYPNNKFLQSLQSREYTKSDFITIDVEPIIDCMMMED